MNDFIETKIINAVKEIILGRVNEIFSNYDILTPIIEFGKYNRAVVPAITLTGCETTEKERIVKLDAYTLTVSCTVPDTPDSEIFCYGYNHAFCKAVGENPTLGGIVDRATVTERKYTPPKIAGSGQDWQVLITLRVTVEGDNYAY